MGMSALNAEETKSEPMATRLEGDFKRSFLKP
jgi:hypothetical protein